MATVWLAGVIIYPALLGVTVYEPFVRPLKVYVPEALAVVVAPKVPFRVTAAPLPPAPLMVPLMVKVCAAELKFAVALAPLIATGWLDGVMTNPEFVGVTVYNPLVRPEKL